MAKKGSCSGGLVVVVVDRWWTAKQSYPKLFHHNSQEETDETKGNQRVHPQSDIRSTFAFAWQSSQNARNGSQYRIATRSPFTGITKIRRRCARSPRCGCQS